MTTENKTSLLLALFCIAIALTIAAISKAGSPTDQRGYWLCGSRDVCAIG